MGDCRYCGQSAEKTIAVLLDGRLLGLTPPLQARFAISSPCALSDLTLANVGVDCSFCEASYLQDLEHLRAALVQLAQDPLTEPKRLLALWNMYQGEPDFGAALAQNPNLPLSLARELVYFFYEELTENPASALWLLEDPGFFQSLEAEFLSQVEEARYEEFSARWRWPVSVGWLRQLARSEDVLARRYAASHLLLPTDLAWELAQDPDPYVRGYLSYHADEALLSYLAQDPEVEVRILVARGGKHLSVLSMLAGDPSGEVRYRLALNRQLDSAYRMRRELLEEPMTEPSAPFWRYGSYAEDELSWQNERSFLARGRKQHQKRRTQQNKEHRQRRGERAFFLQYKKPPR